MSLPISKSSLITMYLINFRCTFSQFPIQILEPFAPLKGIYSLLLGDSVGTGRELGRRRRLPSDLVAILLKILQ